MLAAATATASSDATPPAPTPPPRHVSCRPLAGCRRPTAEITAVSPVSRADGLPTRRHEQSDDYGQQISLTRAIGFDGFAAAHGAGARSMRPNGSILSMPRPLAMVTRGMLMYSRRRRSSIPHTRHEVMALLARHAPQGLIASRRDSVRWQASAFGRSASFGLSCRDLRDDAQPFLADCIAASRAKLGHQMS